MFHKVEKCQYCGLDISRFHAMTGKYRCYYCSQNWDRQPGEPRVSDWGDIPEEMRKGTNNRKSNQ